MKIIIDIRTLLFKRSEKQSQHYNIVVILLPQIITICFLFVWFFFSWVDNVNWLPKEFLKSKVSNLSPLSFVICHAPNVSFKNSLPWTVYFINSVDKTKSSLHSPHQCRTTFFLKNLTPSNNVPGTTEGAQLTALQPI